MIDTIIGNGEVKNMLRLLPSVLSADFANLGRDLDCIKKAGVTQVHVDVMDGSFVPSMSLGFPVIRSMRKVSDLFFDVHLMVEEPGRYLEETKAAGADRIGVHVEACKHLHRTLQQIRALDCEVCVVLNPATPLTALEYVLEDVDVVLLMTVNPGFGGQSYIPAMTEKIRRLRRMIDERGLDVKIELDGGVKLSNAKELIEAGADYLVAGSSVFNGEPEKAIAGFKEIFAGFEA